MGCLQWFASYPTAPPAGFLVRLAAIRVHGGIDPRNGHRDLVDDEGDPEPEGVSAPRELHLVHEVERAAVVEPRTQRPARVRPADEQLLLVGVPVRGVVHVTEDVDVGRAQRPGGARRSDLWNRQLESRRDDTASCRFRVLAEAFDSDWSCIRS